MRRRAVTSGRSFWRRSCSKVRLTLTLNRQSRRFKCEGIDLSVSTLADQVGAGVFAAMPLFRLIEAHVMAAERLHGDDSVLQKRTERMIEMV